MKARLIRQYEMLVRVRDFGDVHGARFPASSVAAAAFAVVTRVVAQLNDHAVAELTANQQGARARRAARATVVDMLTRIRRTARAIQAVDPDFPDTFLLPRRLPAQTILTSARLFTGEIAPFMHKFVAHGMASTIAADLTRAADAYDHQVRDRATRGGRCAAVRASIHASVAAGLQAARTLDVIVANHRDDAILIAQWMVDRRVGRGRIIPRAAAQAAVSAPPVSGGELAPAVLTAPVLRAVAKPGRLAESDQAGCDTEAA